MQRLEMKPDGFPLKLKECPPGFFLYENEICFKSEYGDDCYCDSGEAFWGGTSDAKDRGELVVQPLVYEWAISP